MIIKKSELKLVSIENEVLNTPPKDFIFDGKISSEMLTNIMFDKMSELGGVGLSANQVGLNIKMFVMGIQDAKIEVFNPLIKKYSIEEETIKEGCLSFPGLQVDIRRPVSIEVEYYNKKGEKQEYEFHGLTARIFQHEYDHMLGKTMKVHVSKLKWDMATKRLNNYKNKLIKKYTQKKLLDIQKEIEKQNGNS